MGGNPLLQVIRIKDGGRGLALGGRDSSSLGTVLIKVKTSHKEDTEASVRRTQLSQFLVLSRDGDAGSATGSLQGPTEGQQPTCVVTHRYLPLVASTALGMFKNKKIKIKIKNKTPVGDRFRSILSMASKLAVLKLALATENETLSLFTKQERLRQRKVIWSHSHPHK